MVQDKSSTIVSNVLANIHSERERQSLLALAPDSALLAAAQDTAAWFASEEVFEDRIFDYLNQRYLEHCSSERLMASLRLVYARETWPHYTEAIDISKDLIEKMDLSYITSDPAVDYMAAGHCFAVLDRKGDSIEISGRQPGRFGLALVVAYANDGNSLIVDRINKRRAMNRAAPLQISSPLRQIARKSITLSSADEAMGSLFDEAQALGYAMGGWRVRLNYGGSYAKVPGGSMTPITEMAMADIVATQLAEDWPALLREDWQDIGIATSIRNHPELGGLNVQAEFVTGWRIPADAERPAHFPPPVDTEGNPDTSTGTTVRGDDERGPGALRGTESREPQPKPRRGGGWSPFRSWSRGRSRPSESGEL